MIDQGPTVRQRRLAAELIRLRKAAGLTQERAAGLLGWGRRKIIRIEGVEQTPSVDDVRRILETYGGGDEAIKLAIVQLARDVRKRGWWTSYGDVLAGGYAELEDAASIIYSWQPQIIPGLLQTPEYAHGLISATFSSNPAEVERRVTARMHRQTLLTRPDGPELTFLIGEEALRRPVGGLMSAQLKALVAAAERPNVTIKVLPQSAGFFDSQGQGPMVRFGFTSPLALDVVYVEAIHLSGYVEDVTGIRRCSVILDRLAEVAMSPEESAAFIADIAV